MSDYVVLTVIPNMYRCERCYDLIKERIAIGMRDEKGNHYFHVTDCDTKEKTQIQTT